VARIHSMLLQLSGSIRHLTRIQVESSAKGIDILHVLSFAVFTLKSLLTLLIDRKHGTEDTGHWALDRTQDIGCCL